MNICVFCSSGEGIHPNFSRCAFETGRELAQRGHTIVHGGSTGGLMGKLMLGAIEGQGKVIGVTCDEVRKPEHSDNVFQTIITASNIASRKKIMIEIADAYVILPGGFGTLNEATEVITLKQLGALHASICIINIENYWKNLFQFFSDAEAEEMIITKNRDTFRIYNSLETYLTAEHV